jgi:23S rRNA (adenine2503-C2)-methyltransferase
MPSPALPSGLRPARCRGDFAPVVRRRREGGVLKFVQRLADGELVESVIVPMREKEAGKGRFTLCLSTQAGCRMGCIFCATGRMGFRRDLTPAEIVGQVRAAEALGVRPANLVFMGMGEPLDNFDNWAASVQELITSRPGPAGRPAAYSTKQMIVSTCGVVPGMDRLAALGRRRLVLAVSLNAPNDALRSQLMPVNRRWPLEELRAALLRFAPRGRIFMAEYVLFRGLNDRREHAAELAAWLRPFRACVNLIGYNPVPGAPGGFEPPSAAEVERFRRWLQEDGQYARRRETKGRRIRAACGQLATGEP